MPLALYHGAGVERHSRWFNHLNNHQLLTKWEALRCDTLLLLWLISPLLCFCCFMFNCVLTRKLHVLLHVIYFCTRHDCFLGWETFCAQEALVRHQDPSANDYNNGRMPRVSPILPSVCVISFYIFFKKTRFNFLRVFLTGLLISSERLSFVGEVFVGLTSNRGMPFKILLSTLLGNAFFGWWGTFRFRKALARMARRLSSVFDWTTGKVCHSQASNLLCWSSYASPYTCVSIRQH